MSLHTMSVTNEKIWNFYKQNPMLSFETTNLLVIELISKLIPDINNGVPNNIAEQLIENIKNIQSQLSTVTETMQYNHNDNIIKIAMKLSEFKREYMEDVKMILNNNIADKFAPLLREQNSMLLDKTNLLINEIVPKNNEVVSKQLSDSFKMLHSSIIDDTNKFLGSTINAKTFGDFITNIEQKFTQSEQRIDSNIKEIRSANDKILESSTQQNSISSTLNTTVTDILRKMENVSSKGKISENIVFNILNSLFPSAQEIVYVGDKKESGDILLIRENKPKILIENKNWDRNVSKDEVDKFIRDTEIQNCCGLFLSQHTGISNKVNFEISIHNNKHVLLFIHDVNYEAEKIKVGIEIIDRFKEMLINSDNINDVDTIDKETLDNINKEFQECYSQKLNLLKIIKDCSQKMLKQVEEIKFPNLEKYLSTKYSSSVGKMNCDQCGFIAKNQQALSAHKRACDIKKNGTEFGEVQNIKDCDITSTEVDRKPATMKLGSKKNKQAINKNDK